MKKKVIMILSMACLLTTYACDDQYTEIETTEITEQISTEPHDDERVRPTSPGSGGTKKD